MKYRGWAEENCNKFCGFCSGGSGPGKYITSCHALYVVMPSYHTSCFFLRKRYSLYVALYVVKQQYIIYVQLIPYDRSGTCKQTPSYHAFYVVNHKYRIVCCLGWKRYATGQHTPSGHALYIVNHKYRIFCFIGWKRCAMG